MARELVISGDNTISTDLGVPTGALKLGGSLELVGTGNVITTPHDALYAYPTDMLSNGTLVPESAQDVGVPRWSLADAATQRVKWSWAIPVGWNTIAIRWGYDNEVGGAGNIVWQLSYQQVVFGTANIDVGAVTDIAVGPIAASAVQYTFNYALPTSTASIAVPAGGLGDKPVIMCSLSRLGADGADTLAGAAAVTLATATRIT